MVAWQEPAQPKGILTQRRPGLLLLWLPRPNQDLEVKPSGFALRNFLVDDHIPAHPTTKHTSEHRLANTTQHSSLGVSPALKPNTTHSTHTGLGSAHPDYPVPPPSPSQLLHRSALSLKGTIPNPAQCCSPSDQPHSSQPDQETPQKYPPDPGETSPIPITSCK